jgi:hypothetical protein
MKSILTIEAHRQTFKQIPLWVIEPTLKELGYKDDELHRNQTEIFDQANYDYIKYIFNETLNCYSDTDKMDKYELALRRFNKVK